MSRLDLTIRKHPEHEEGIRFLASRDPSGNMKYLEWGAGILASGQAPASEIADVVELFHQFKGSGRGRRRRDARWKIDSDIYTCRPSGLAKLRDTLIGMKRAQDRKRRARERLYKIEGEVEADVVYESDDLLVRHIKNKAASAHYGLGTKWRISMLREDYFDSYESENATFFFFERKIRLNDEFDKAAVMITRDREHSNLSAFTSLDRHTNTMALARAYGVRIFDVFRDIYLRSLEHPPSALFQADRGEATAQELESIFEKLERAQKEFNPYDTRSILVAICCNDLAPWSLLEKIYATGQTMLLDSWRYSRDRTRSQRLRRRRVTESVKRSVRSIVRDMRAALFVHPNTPDPIRADLMRALRRSRVSLSSIHRTHISGRARVEYATPGGPIGRYRRRSRRRYRRPRTPKALLKRSEVLARTAKRLRKQADTLQRKLDAKKLKRSTKGKRT